MAFGNERERERERMLLSELALMSDSRLPHTPTNLREVESSA